MNSERRKQISKAVEELDTIISDLECNGRSELLPGRALLHFTDLRTGGDFTLKEAEATPERIAAMARSKRQEFGLSDHQPAMAFALALGLLWTLGGAGSLVYFAIKAFAP